MKVLRLAVGLIWGTIAFGQGVGYQYDLLNRLVRVGYPDGTIITYTYDSAGNRLSQVISNPAMPLPKVSVDKSTLTFSAAAGQAASAQTVTVGNVGGGNLQWVASPTASWLSVTPGSGTNSGTVNVTASAAGMPAGTYNANVTILASASNAPLSVPVIFTVTGAQGNPLVSSGGIVSAAGSSPGIARGSVASIYGSALADLPASATTVPLPLALVNVQVSVNGLKAPLWYVGPGQINFQVPFEAPLQGPASVIVSRDGVASAPSNVTLTPYAPSVFMYQRAANALDPIIVHAANNQLVTPTSPAVPGEYLTVYGTGIGDLNVLPVTGALSPENPVATATLTPTATIGGVKATVSFAGLTPDAVGLAQFNILVPGSLPVGNPLPLVINFGGAMSAPVNLAVTTPGQTPNISTIVSGSAALYSVGLAADSAGNIYLTNEHLSSVSKTSPSGITTIVAGNGTAGFSGDGGPALAAELNSPDGVAVNRSSNMYISDFDEGRVRVVTPDGKIATFAGNGQSGVAGDGGPATQAQLDRLWNVAVDAAGDVYIVGLSTVRKVGKDGIIHTVAGDPSCSTSGYNGDGGLATNACLNGLGAIALDPFGGLYIVDSANDRVRRVDPATGIINTFAGVGTAGFSGDGGPAIRAQLFVPSGIAIDQVGNVYISDTLNQRIRKVALDGTITTVVGNGGQGYAGDGGPPEAAELNIPGYIALDQAGNLYILDEGNHVVRRVVLP